ncbi:cactus-binding C-terminus of cactin protein-domain-containing protein [Sphaerosporella brunnea]|uniref:Cactus-binding C-terminus of cactin protein-domain-containing protein n=1 Tax=Sphaerosporella brunnea TaxID=1250544 RepID=A0A5J5ELB6_9PEZI|nr:cactus-binding C-terminus of cactin protein-domain-containing protein [Sphaerosporella brunnea]
MTRDRKSGRAPAHRKDPGSKDHDEEQRRHDRNMKEQTRLNALLGPKDSDERLRYEDKGLETIDEKEFLANLAAERKKIQKMGYVESSTAVAPVSRFAAVFNDDFSQATKTLYERSSSRPRLGRQIPRYFNHVQMGYEWNKYNQTHYDHDNPPPKVVQGYKFNIFYPDLIDISKTPTYGIGREGGRKRGQSFAPAGEEDTCLIWFIARPPYEDISFRIVDKEWDYSAKRERGFKSSFHKGILQLHPS